MRTFRLTLCYEGTRSRGWQRQGNTPDTLQAKLEALLGRLLEQEIELAGSGRTDAGVHARRQVCSFRAETDRSCGELLAALREHLPEDVGALALEEAEPRFHARLSCTGKRYVYRVWNSAEPCVFERRWVHPFPAALDVPAMERAAALLVGTHDFTAFCASKRMKKSAMRTLRAVEIRRAGEELRLRFEGDGFLYHMVRILTGTLLEVGTGERSAEEMPEILASRDRARAGFTAPAKGLTLWDVSYD